MGDDDLEREVQRLREWNAKLVEAIGPYDTAMLSPVGAILYLRESIALLEEELRLANAEIEKLRVGGERCPDE